jgi:hypothetical protein
MDTAACADTLTSRLDHSQANRQSGLLGDAMLYRDGPMDGLRRS